MIMHLQGSFAAISRSEEAETICSLEETLIYVQKCMNETKLRMNPDKTEFIFFGSRQHLQKCSSDIIEVCGDKIKKSESVRYLGGYLDKNLNFQEHVRKMCSIAMANFVKIREIRQYLSSEACHTLVL